MGRLHYWIENSLLRGVHVHLFAVLILIVSIALVGGAAAYLVTEQFAWYGEAVWWAFLRLTDPGYLGDDEGLALRTVSTLLTIAGYVVFLGALVAILTSWMNRYFDLLRQGRSPVYERGHFVVLGWSGKVPTVVREFAMSDERVRRLIGRRKPAVVILMPRMEGDESFKALDSLKEVRNGVRLLFRTGNMLSLEDLQRVRVHEAAAVVIGAAERSEGVAHADTRTLKSLLALEQLVRTYPGHGPNVVAELTYALNEDLARSVCQRTRFRPIASDQMVSRLVVQMLRHPGISSVLAELFTHSQGNEVYVVSRPQEVPEGVPFHQIATDLYERALPIGIKRRDHADKDGESIVINPDPNEPVNPGDELVVIARELRPRRKRLKRPHKPMPTDRAPSAPGSQESMTILILGWNSKVTAILRELDTYTGYHNRVKIVSSRARRELETRLARYAPNLKNTDVEVVERDFTVPIELATVEPERHDRILLMATDRIDEPETSDARTLTALLRLRQLLHAAQVSPPVIVELLDPVNQRLYDFRPNEDVIVTHEIVSHILTQVALRPDLSTVFEELFTAGGPEIQLFNVSRYLDGGGAGAGVTFGQLERNALAHGERLIGIRSGGDLAINPPKDQKWSLGSDTLGIVIAPATPPAYGPSGRRKVPATPSAE